MELDTPVEPAAAASRPFVDAELAALLAAADPGAVRALRHLWLVRLMDWLRGGRLSKAGAGLPVLRLRHLLDVLAQQPACRAPVVGVLARFWHENDLAALFADVGFATRADGWGAIGERLRLRLLPVTPDTDDLSALFQLLFTDDRDPDWLAAVDADTLLRLGALWAEARQVAPRGSDLRAPLLHAMTWLVSAVRAAAFAPALRRRMAPELVAAQPFEQLVRAGEALAQALQQGDDGLARQQAAYLHTLLARCHQAADSVTAHLDEHGVSVPVVAAQAQMLARIGRLEALLRVLVAALPARELQHLLVDLVAGARQRRSLRALWGTHYSLLARKIAERHAETGEHYITRTPEEHRRMLRQAGIGGLVIAGTTFGKFALLALGLAPFWAGFAAGLNYALSFLLIHLLHGTVATKQPAMTAPALAARLADVRDDAAVQGFVDEVTHLVRSQTAGILGNLAAVVPAVLLLQGLAGWLVGAPLIDAEQARHVLHAQTVWGPTLVFAAFTGVLLFAGSVIAGWVENAFVYHRLDSALAWHPRLVARLGAARSARWAAWWRANISGVAANVALGLLLGLVPTLLAFVGVPLDVRHVTLSAGQLTAAAATLGLDVWREPGFWACVAAVPLIGLLNLGVSFWLALKVALRSRGIGTPQRRQLRAALWQRLRQAPRRFFWPD